MQATDIVSLVNQKGLLELAKQLGNFSQACKMMGYSRDSSYRFKDLYEKGGELWRCRRSAASRRA